MKRLLLLVCIFSFVLSSIGLGIVPGMKRSMYGGSIEIWPFGFFYFGISGFYEEGMQLYYYEPMKLYVDGYFGPSFDYGQISYVYTNIQVFSLRFNGEAVVYTDKFSFEVFGVKLYPGVRVGGYLYWDVVGFDIDWSDIGIYKTKFSVIGPLGIGLSGPDIVLLTSFPKEGETTISWYVWPIPLIIGVTVWNY